MSTVITASDSRFEQARRTRNGRFPLPDQIVKQVNFCQDAEDVAKTLQQVLDAGMRPTARSSGHCYEDFIVNNPKGAILDISSLNYVHGSFTGGGPYKIGPGAMLGNIYGQLYRLNNVTVPGGSCFTVCAGGHMSGGGYGVLARKYGITVDYIVGVDIVTVDNRGKAIALHADKMHYPDLFRALRGGQGSNFGIITAIYIDNLPPKPEEVAEANISWDWDTMTEDKFVEILTTYGKYFEENDQKKETWGLFTGLGLNGKTKGGRFGIGLQFSDEQGTANNTEVVQDFLNRFQKCKPATEAPVGVPRHDEMANGGGRRGGPQQPRPVGDTVCYGEHELRKSSWLEANVGGQGGGSGLIMGPNRRAKYKSCYMKKGFSPEEASAYYKVLTSGHANGLIVAVDSYGGATNNPERAKDTAVPQRSSVLKLQYQSYWQDEKDDEYRLNGIREVFTAAYSTSVADQKHLGTPYPNDHYDGCYINYPDVDMLEHDYWPQLYYGTGDLYPMLQTVKRKYDPHNIFHHAMSIRG